MRVRVRAATLEVRVAATLTKDRLATALCDELGFSRREAKDTVESFFESISAALARGERVKLSGFGSFGLRDKGERPGRNPRTGEAVPVLARRVVTFRASRNLRAVVAGEGDTPR